ncbi:GNAT family N-acetyltransferase [Aquimarina sp. Aq78]|uniref:GNAT family N-acetyltransferase n=1 Tax=Aquimarina sp. Aq78 TaxID=1191889 RepID=UPI000D114986|nr:GNAT family N-acetyltransferase [Aquimarina sp. Aq78]
MSKDLKYRVADINDLEGLRQLGKISYAEFSNILSTENWNTLSAILESEENVLNLIEISKIFICEIDSDIAGMIYFIPNGNPTELYESDWCYIRFLGVDPKYRGLGIGKELVDFCIRYAKKSEEKIIALHTSEFMNAARIMYEKKGFKRIKEIERLGKKYWVYTMRLPLIA